MEVATHANHTCGRMQEEEMDRSIYIFLICTEYIFLLYIFKI